MKMGLEAKLRDLTELLDIRRRNGTHRHMAINWRRYFKKVHAKRMRRIAKQECDS